MPKPTRISKPAIKALHADGLYSQFDNAAQTVLVDMLPACAAAKSKLTKTFAVEDSEAAMRGLFHFHSQTIGQMEKRTAATPPQQEQVHQFYSLIYHLLPQDKKLDEYRQAIDDAFKVLGLPPRLSEDQVRTHMPNILAFTAKTLEKGGV